jgi:hypothetical protein
MTTASMTTTGRKLDKLDELILDIYRNAGERGLTDEEAMEQLSDWIARSDDIELQRLADADPELKHWRKVKPPLASALN